jgi:hypothetical protein
MNSRKLGFIAACAATVAMSGQANAQSAAAATGIAAGLGLTAASGKTTLNSGAGVIEAAVLSSDAVIAAGAEIRSRVAAVAGGRSVLVVGRTDTLDLATARWMQMRVSELHNELDAAQTGCAPVNPIHPLAAPAAAGKPAAGLQAAPADITAALATDVTISPIALSVDDRLLISAVASPATPSRGWMSLGATPTPDTASNSFSIPGEIVSIGTNSPLLADYDKIQSVANALAATQCKTDQAKAAIADVTSFVNSVSSASKGQAPIIVAAELLQYSADAAYVLRVGVEQSGGTAITRANIWYTLGFPGAATVSTGLLASYRLIDPSTGAVKASGLVRCLTRTIPFRDVQASLSDPKTQVCQVALS